jgi:hypothetical protein
MEFENIYIESIKSTISKNFKIYNYLIQHKYGWPILDPIREEICVCILTGSNQAVITLTNHLLEKSLKFFLIQTEQFQVNTEPTCAKDYETHFRQANFKYGKLDLNDTINRCCTKGLITKEQKKSLHLLRDEFRNAFGHAESDKTFEESTISVILFNPFINQEVPEPAAVKCADFPFIQGHKQKDIANKKAIPYFEYIDNLIKDVLPKLNSLK